MKPELAVGISFASENFRQMLALLVANVSVRIVPVTKSSFPFAEPPRIPQSNHAHNLRGKHEVNLLSTCKKTQKFLEELLLDKVVEIFVIHAMIPFQYCSGQMVTERKGFDVIAAVFTTWFVFPTSRLGEGTVKHLDLVLFPWNRMMMSAGKTRDIPSERLRETPVLLRLS